MTKCLQHRGNKIYSSGQDVPEELEPEKPNDISEEPQEDVQQSDLGKISLLVIYSI